MIILYVLFALVFGGGLVLVIMGSVRSGSLRKQRAREMADFEKRSGNLDETTEIEARVTGKRMELLKNGRRHEMIFVATFLSGGGKSLAYRIPEEIYEKLEEGQSGTLLLVNGNFFDFCADAERK